MASDKGERTEQPTGKRLDKARKEGNVPRTTELSSMLGIAAFLIYTLLFGRAWVNRLSGLWSFTFSHLHRPDMSASELIVVLGSNVIEAGSLVAGPLSAMVVAGMAGNLLQGRPNITLKPFKPDLKRINPVQGFKKVFSAKQLVELLRTVIKLTLFTSVAYFAARGVILTGATGAPGAEGTLAAFALVARRMLLWVVILAALVAILDLLFQRWNHTRSLRMTKKEVKDERRETDGDPQVKLKIRQKQLALARTRMMADVEKSTVVVTNPTHYAIALRFVPGEMDVPKVMAKGRAKLAERIREIALEHRVPIIQDPPLARALYKAVPVGGEVPPALFRAVAEVLAMVFRKKTRRRGASRGRTIGASPP